VPVAAGRDFCRRRAKYCPARDTRDIKAWAYTTKGLVTGGLEFDRTMSAG